MTYLGKEHPLRDAVDREIRARPYIELKVPERISHLAVLSGEHGVEEERYHLVSLCQRYDVPPPPVGASHFIADLGAFRIRWERHTEFSTYTFLREENCDEPFVHPPIEYVPEDWMKDIPGEVISAVHLELQGKETSSYSENDRSRFFKGHTYLGCDISGGAASLWTDMRVHDDRFVRILMRDEHMSPRQAGRVVQRILEIESYRVLAFLALPLARDASPRIKFIDEQLAIIAGKMSDQSECQNDAVLLEELSSLAAEIEEISALNSYRFGATKAYYAIVQQRLNELRQTRLAGLPTLSETIERRMAPAMKTCNHVGQRQHFLSQRISRVATLLRARVEVELERQNQQVLETMNKRAGIQLRLQETVEGLSVVAISYYLVGLLGYGAKGVKALGIPINPDMVMGGAIPIVAFTLWSAIRKTRKYLLKEN